MGRYTSPIRISGSFNDLTLCNDGTARMKSSLTKKKWQTDPDYAQSRRAAHIFGGASTLANHIYRYFPEQVRKLARSHGHNHIASAIRQAIGRQSPERITFEMALPALHQLDISAGQCIQNKVRIRTLGNPVQPKGIHITGLQEAAAALKQQWANRHATGKHTASAGRNNRKHTPAAKAPGTLQFRLHLVAMDFQEVYWHTDEWKREDSINRKYVPVGNWMDVEAVPDEGMAFKIASPNTQMPQIAFLGIEWRFNPAAGNPKGIANASKMQTLGKPLKDHDLQEYSLLKVAALFRPEASLHLPLPDCMAHEGIRRYHPLMTRTVARRPALSAALKFRLSLPLQGTNYNGVEQNDWIGYAPELLLPVKRRRNPGRAQHRSIRNQEEPAPNHKEVPRQNAPNHMEAPRKDAHNLKARPRVSPDQAKTRPKAGQAKSAPIPHLLRTNSAPDRISTQTLSHQKRHKIHHTTPSESLPISPS